MFLLPPSSAEQSRLKAVRKFTETHLASLHRETGETYASHGREVAEVLRELHVEPSLLAIAHLHDILVHPDGESLLNRSPLTDDERTITRHMHRLRRRHMNESTDDLEYSIGAFVEDPRVMILRMAHRLNDIRHLDRFQRSRRKELAHETLHIYTAISGQLGFHRWRWQMEDICFRELQPRLYANIANQFADCARHDRLCLQHAKEFLSKKLSEKQVTSVIDSRVKGVYSTYRKMVLKQKAFLELTDRIALRIMVDSNDDCYRALGVVHSVMHPAPRSLKDYIGIPKENGYRSIHTVVYPLAGVTELPMEIQIRTHDMHRECEEGVAAHANYKNIHYALSTKLARANLFRNMEHLRSMATTPKQFERALQVSFQKNDLLIFDERDQFYHVPPPATALDFACCVLSIDPSLIESVRINGRAQPLSTPLHDGDTVRVITGKNRHSLSSLIRACMQKQTRKCIRNSWRALAHKE